MIGTNIGIELELPAIKNSNGRQIAPINTVLGVPGHLVNVLAMVGGLFLDAESKLATIFVSSGSTLEAVESVGGVYGF